MDYVLFSDSTVEGRDERAAMVCDHFAQAARHPHLHAGQRAIARNVTLLRARPLAMELAAGFVRAVASAFGIVCTAIFSIWTTRRHILSVETGVVVT